MSTATYTDISRDSPAAESETPFSVAKDVIQLLSQTKSTLGAAESLTAGGLMSAITSVPGASAVFRGGVVSYATELKKSLLSVDSDLIAREGVIHGEVAAQMAEGARKATSFPGGETTTWGVGTTGVAGPGLQDGKEAGTVYVGISYGGSQGSKEGEEGEQQWSKSVGPFKFKGGREEVRQQTILEALRALREAIGGY
ncbi:hypothetical protein QBC42DRAFT_308427 [Cladorrhinum samala]|uniref:CinA C-terminal domain-containing protein n=1 Tax=Cladorrhinum samala TaxID=585594 RepID=A0AAV9HFG9_9PEZI|nr:hypothetical protein QBC42DRAFT_308427 [Cladorrhinum samala]